MSLEKIRQHYPNAVKSDDYINDLYARADRDFGIAPNDIMLLHSICSDDLNSIQLPARWREMLGPFNMGGLNGFPFAGATGMGAFAKHIPDDGAALIFYAPHIGIGSDGTVGKVLRPGQAVASTSCGAAAAALGKLEQNTIFAGGRKDETDFQMQTLEEIVAADAELILSAENRLTAVTETVYRATEKRINELIAKTEFLGKYIFVAGAIIINGDRDAGMFIEPRRFDCLDAKTKAMVNG